MNDTRGGGRGSGEGIGVVTSIVSTSFLALKARTKLRRGFAMAEQAERADVIEVALATAFSDGKDVVGIPQAASAGDGLHAVEAEAGYTSRTAGTFEGGVGGDGVDVAGGASAAVAGEDLIAQIAGVGAQAPLMDTVVAAEGAAAVGDDLKIAPAAQRKTVGASGKIVP